MYWNGFSLETERLLLRVLDEFSADVVLDFHQRNREFFEPWDPIKTPEFFTLGYQEELLRLELERMKRGEMCKVWLCKKADPTLIIGMVSLNNIIRGAFQSCHLGYKIDQAHQNQGYMTEAVKAIVDFGFQTLALHRIEANIIPINTSSLRVVKKLGFTPEGLAKQYLKINGKWQDHLHMVLLNENMV